MTIETRARQLIGRRVTIRTTYDYTHIGRIGHVRDAAYLDLLDIEDGGAQRRVQLDRITDLTPVTEEGQ